MKPHALRASVRPTTALLLAIAATACSGDYPLGTLDPLQWLGDDGTDLVRPVSSGVVGIPDETLSLEMETGSVLSNVTAIGDFDGDGFDDLMASGVDPAKRT